MRTYDRHYIGPESCDAMRAAGRFNPAREIRAPYFFLDRKPSDGVVISAGSADDVDVFVEGDNLYVLSSNKRFGYVGLEVFARDGSEVGNIFVQNDEDKILDLIPINRAKHLAQYIGS